MKISVIIPIFNSEKSIKLINSEIINYFSSKEYLYEIIYVNDNSLDNSKKILNELFDEHIKVIHLKKNYGQQNAIFCGMHFASGDFIVTMDDDLQHNINDLDKLIEEIQIGYDLVYGVYQNHLNKSFRHLGSKLTGLFFKTSFKIGNLRVSSFRIFSKEILKKSLKCQYKFIYLSAIMLKDNPKISNVNIVRRQRIYGKSGYDIRKLLLLFLKLNFYYSKLSIEVLKSRGRAYEIDSLLGIKEEMINEKSYDVRGWKLSAECN